MAEYYAVERTPEYLMHYGIKGMKWGVQKAKYKGDIKSLSRHYSKAMKKIKKYKDKMNIDKQKEAYNYHLGKFNRSALATSAMAGIGAGGLLGRLAIDKNKLPTSYIKVFTHMNGQTTPVLQPVYSGNTTGKNILTGLGIAGAVGAVGGAAKTGYHAGKTIAAGYRSTAKGHERAVKKYAPKVREWEDAVSESFKGTRFGKNGHATKLTKQLQRSAKEYLKNKGYEKNDNSATGVHTMVPSLTKKRELSNSDARALLAIASNPDKYRFKRHK